MVKKKKKKAKKKKKMRENKVYGKLGSKIMEYFKTQLELAKVLGLTQQTTSKKLRDETVFLIADLEKIAKHLGVPVASFFTTDTIEESKLFTWLKKNPKLIVGLQKVKDSRCKIGPLVSHLMAGFEKR